MEKRAKANRILRLCVFLNKSTDITKLINGRNIKWVDRKSEWN